MEPLRFASFSWVSLLDELTSKGQPGFRLSVLETIAFSPATSVIDVWVYTDQQGILRRNDRKTLLKSELIFSCLHRILTPAELDLYHSEVANFSTSNSMRKACFLLFRDGRRKLVKLNSFLRLVHCPEKLVTAQVVGIQFYTQAEDSAKDYMYVVNVVCLPEGHYELQLFKVWYKCKFPDNIISQAPLQASPLEMRLVRASQDLLKIAEDRLHATIRDMQLLFMLDAHKTIRLVGTQQTLLRDVVESSSKSRLSNLRLSTPLSSEQPRSQSTSFLASRFRDLQRSSDSPLRPISTLIRPKFKARVKVPVVRPSPLSRLKIVPRVKESEPVAESPVVPATTNELAMVDQEAQATNGDSVDSPDVRDGLHQQRSLSRLSPTPGGSGFFRRPMRSSLGSYLQSVNSTILLPEPDSVPRRGVMRLGSLNHMRKTQTRRKDQRALRK